MNAEDLVITFKRDIASLSRTERRRLRLRGRALPALRVRRGREEGQIKERRAALPLPGLRQDLRHGQRAHPGDEQAPEGDLDGQCRVLRSHAAPARMRGRCHVRLKTAYTMRHRLIECLSAYSPSFKTGRGCGCELDETDFPESFKGNHTKGSFTMPRHSRHRGKQVHRRGLSREQICVMTGVNDSNETFLQVSGRGILSRKRAMDVLRDRIASASVVATDKASAYVDILAELEVDAHTAYDSKDPSEGTINRINTVHSLLDTFMKPFKGVSTKHLGTYLAWFKWCRTFMATDSGTAERTVARQLANGVCRSRIHDMFNVLPP